ncbi:hypothetical protein BOX15_Mlig000614g2 [Macrostomum lignano]|uniref:Uncharacterized protein n=2 Tax=Macrostomum lignano TaxID=282301 RepID=A0A267DWQ9_9PLAT|nr:hypothetical protein BOX15_Mlig000614g2 [Macrostomum lignano]
MANRCVSLYLVTWNVGDKGPPNDNLQELLNQHTDAQPDVVAIGLQEAKKETDWLDSFRRVLLPRGYVLVKQRSLWAIHLFVFVMRKHLVAVQNIESEVTRSGYGGVLGNKGGVSIRMDLYGVNFIIVNAHFTAHITENHERIEDFMDIIDNQKFKDTDVEKLLDHDFVFWIGDLNFRINDLDHDLVLRKVEQKSYAELMKHDQLMVSKDAGLIFARFHEGQINFPPTYKFDKNTDRYDTSSKQRKPAWTDRILHLINEDNFENLVLSIDQQWYRHLPQYKTSDHRPVCSLYQLKVFDKAPRMPVVMETDPVYRVHHKENCKLQMRYRINHKCKQRFQPDSWDWLGLFEDSLPDFASALSRVYAPSTDTEDTDFGVDATLDLPSSLQTGLYRLVYFSVKKNCPVGYSDPVKIFAERQRSPVTIAADFEYRGPGRLRVTYTVHHSCKQAFSPSAADSLRLVADDSTAASVQEMRVPTADTESTGFGVDAIFDLTKVAPGSRRTGSYRVLYFSSDRMAVMGQSATFKITWSVGSEV